MRALTICAHAGRPTFTRSAPGMGKSSIHKQVSNALGFTMLDRRLAQEDAVDSKGMPAVVKGRTIWAQPEWFPKAPGYAIFFDEFPQANTLTMNAYSEMILDRTMGGEANYKLPPGTPIFLAGNLDKHRAGTNRMPTHLNNRLVHFDLEFDLDNYIQHHMDPDAITSLNIPVIPKTSNQMHELVMAFARWRPSLIQPDLKAEEMSGAFPTARSWSFVSDLLPYLLANDDLQYPIVAGCVGEGPAMEFRSFLNLVTKMPDPDLIFKHPNEAAIPTNEVSIMYALMTALAARVTPKTADAMFTYLNRPAMPQDFAVICVKDATKRNAVILQCKQGMAWTIKNAKVLI